MSYSNSGGGTLTLPSPTHVRHVDVTSAVRSLRRSLSRSPSKFNLKVQKSPAHSPKSSLSPSPSTPASPSKLGPNRAGFFGTPTHGPSPLAKPFPPSVKLSLRSASRAKNSPTTATKTRTSPRSPLKRVLSESYDRANSQPPPGVASRNDQENRRCENISQIERRSLEKQSRDKNMFNLDVTGPINQALARLEGTDSGPMIPSTSSPLKRSDAIMNLDQASLGSPVAKRRSLHGSASFGHDFNVFDHAPTSSPQFDIHDDTNSQDHERPVQTFTAGNASMFSMPKRSSSLRKSTLQQRQEKSSSWGRRHGHAAFELSSLSNEYSTPAAPKNRPRLSLDQFVAPMPRDSPFSSQGSLPNASIHMFNPQQQLQQKQHPLSRSTLTTSSSDSSMADESPTHVPPHFGQQPRPKLDFSKSLPVGALRPLALEAISREEFGSKTFSTPENYKSAKPLPAAFMSTGLISKVKNHPNQPAVSMQDFRKSNMPDTPCKKPLTGYNTMPTAAVAGSAIARARQVRHSFGAPSTPFNPYGTESQGAFDQAGLVFGSSFSNRHRRGSFISNDGDEPENQAESQSDYDFPPTPTKQTLVHNTGHKQSNGSPQSLRGLPIPAFGAGMARYPRMSTSPLDCIDFNEKHSPHTPQEDMLPPNASRLSLSARKTRQLTRQATSSGPTMAPPATPTAGRESFNADGGVTPVNGSTTEVDEGLMSRFEKIELIGTGEFSVVYRVTQPQNRLAATQPFYFGASGSPLQSRSPPSPLPGHVFAVKKARQPYQGARDRQRKLQEVSVLKALGQSDHVVHLIDSWEKDDYLYIQTEYCEEGSLDVFLSQVGRKGRLDDFRIWKIMLELGQGLRHIHDSGYIHLDLKPANIFITFEGVLKIGDFGMATSYPAQPGIEGEGDREYIGPEILLGHYDKPADIFALGLIMLEIAGNVQLPDNGPSWQRLRSGDMSDCPSLTWSTASGVSRDATGTPVDDSDTSMDSCLSDEEIERELNYPQVHGRKRNYNPTKRSTSHDPGNLFGSIRRGELHDAPAFMRNPKDSGSLDVLVKWMITPQPEHRPTIYDILNWEGVRWVEGRRRAGATVFEGSWGPADDVLADDAEMLDV